MKKFWAIFYARNLEFWREKASLGSNFIMPFFLVTTIYFIFSDGQQYQYKVALYHSPTQIKDTQKLSFLSTKYIHFIQVDVLPDAIKKVKHHQYDLLIEIGSSYKYWINSSSPKSYILEKILLSDPPKQLTRQILKGGETNYIDWFIPGILGMNMMFSCLFGVGYTIVRYRKNQFLRRLKATPLTPFTFITAQVVSRLFIVSTVTSIIFFGCKLFINFKVEGSYLLLLLIMLLGAFCMISFGVMMAGRTKSEELAGGILNLVTWPMMLLSEIWFSLDGTPQWIQQLSQIFPLTHIIKAARAVMTEGSDFATISPHLITLTMMSIFFLIIGAYLFKWE